MPLAAFLSGPTAILLGMAMLSVAFVLRRSGANRARQSAKRDPLAEVRADALAETAGRSQLRQLELRLHDYGREIDGLAQTRIALLRELIETADRSAAELRMLLERADNDDESEPSVAA